MIRRRQFFALAAGLAAMGLKVAHADEAILVRRFGAPKTRVQGGTRSSQADAEVLVLVSEETALTATAQPDLYWFLSDDFGLRIDLSITPVGSRQPVLQRSLKRGATAGIHRLSLLDEAAGLEEGVEHVFAVNLVPDPTTRTADRTARGTIKYAPHDPFRSAEAAASAGYWVQAFALAEPATRVALLDEVNLQPAADWLRKAG
jgi:hypothetical protein